MNTPPPVVKVKRVSALRPETEALLEAGKAMIADSVEVGREFAKFMISFAASAVPIYLGLIALLGIKESKSPWLFLPPGVFVLSIIFFVLAYFPKYGSFSLEILEEIEAARLRAISGGDKFLYSGLGCFLLAVMLAAGVLIQEGSHTTARGYQIEVVSIEIPRNANAQDMEVRLQDFKKRLHGTKKAASIEFREVKSDLATLLIAIIRTEDQ